MSPPTSDERVRLFVALDLPGDARARLAEWRDAALGARPELRPVAPEALHVTLAFLGYRAVGQVAAIGNVVGAAVEGLAPASLTPREVVGVPPRRPRLFALDLGDEEGRAAAVQAAVSDALEAGGFYEPEKRPFWPHVTLARVRRGERAAAVESSPPAELFRASEVTLYRSHLSPRGARYEALMRVELSGAATGRAG